MILNSQKNLVAITDHLYVIDLTDGNIQDAYWVRSKSKHIADVFYRENTKDFIAYTKYIKRK